MRPKVRVKGLFALSNGEGLCQASNLLVLFEQDSLAIVARQFHGTGQSGRSSANDEDFRFHERQIRENPKHSVGLGPFIAGSGLELRSMQRTKEMPSRLFQGLRGLGAYFRTSPAPILAGERVKYVAHF